LRLSAVACKRRIVVGAMKGLHDQRSLHATSHPNVADGLLDGV
jgi:hypothetical protein